GRCGLLVCFGFGCRGLFVYSGSVMQGWKASGASRDPRVWGFVGCGIRALGRLLSVPLSARRERQNGRGGAGRGGRRARHRTSPRAPGSGAGAGGGLRRPRSSVRGRATLRTPASPAGGQPVLFTSPDPQRAAAIAG